MYINFNDTAIRERIVFIISDLLKNNMIKSKAQLARDVCVSPQQLNEILAGRNKLTADFVLKLCTSTKASFEYITTGKSPVYDKNQLPETIHQSEELLEKNNNKLDQNGFNKAVPIYELGATAGNVEVYQDMALQQPSGHLNIPGFEDCDFAMPVWGHSMYPTYENGSYVICRWISDELNINWGEAYYIEWADYRMIKRLIKGDSETEVYLCSDNENEKIAGRQKYAPIIINKNEIRKMALIKGVYKKNHH